VSSFKRKSVQKIAHKKWDNFQKKKIEISKEKNSYLLTRKQRITFSKTFEAKFALQEFEQIRIKKNYGNKVVS
jgi:hypothetical protein